jgi:hypothetical protein
MDGTNDPTNYLLLCSHCHHEHPDEWGVPAQLVWLFHHELELDRLHRRTKPFVSLACDGLISHERAKALLLSAHGDE